MVTVETAESRGNRSVYCHQTCNFTLKMTNTNLLGSIIDCYRVEADLDIHTYIDPI